MNIFIQVGLISTEELFCLPPPPPPPPRCKQIHSYRRMACLIRMLSDLYTKRGTCRKALSARKTLGTTVPQDENFTTCAPLGLKPPT